MIKKLLLSLGIISFGLISFSNACSYTAKLSYVGQNFGAHQSIYSNAYMVGVLNYGTFISQNLGVGKSIFAMDNGLLLFWAKNGLPYFIGERQGYFDYYAVCDTFDSTENAMQNCSLVQLNNDSKPMIANFFNSVKSTDYFGYEYFSESYRGHFNFCQSSETIGKSVCFVYERNTRNSSSDNSYCHLINSEGYRVNFSTITTEIYGESPGLDGGNSGGGGSNFDNSFNGNLTLTTDDYIKYYEDKGYTQNLCFVGTWDLSSNSYDDFKFTRNGNGEHIFNFFRYAYNVGTGDYYSSQSVEHFLDEIYMNNYTFWEAGFYESGDLVNIYHFDYPTNNYLDWDTVGFNSNLYPYSNKPLVYQLYPHQLYYYIPDWRLYYTSTDLVNYCYYKLGFSENSTDGVNSGNYSNAGNLGFSGNSALDYNVSQWKIIDSNFGLTMSGNIAVVSEDWQGSPIDYFVGVNNLSGYEDFDAGTFFSTSFNRFKGVFGDLKPGDFGFGYLPGYIITFMLAFILFRFLSH